MNQLLITPKSDGPDRLQFMGPHGKVDVSFVAFDQPVRLGQYTIVGRPDVSPNLMTKMQVASANLYHLLMSSLENPESLLNINPDFFSGWLQIAQMCKMEGTITLLLLTDQDKIVLFTFRTSQSEVLAYEFTEPHLYNAGMLLRRQDVVDQWVREHELRVANLTDGFDDANVHAIVDLDAL